MQRQRLLLSVLVIVASLMSSFRAQADDSMLPFPYTWDVSTSNTDFRSLTDDPYNWGWMPAYEGFWIMTSKNKWVGKVLASKLPFNLPESGKASYSFWYNVSDEVTFTLRGYRNEEVIDLGTIDVEGTQSTYVYTSIQFDTDGPMRLGIEATLTGGNGNCFGSAIIKGIGVMEAGADMAAVQILNPTTGCVPALPMTVSARYENLTSADVTNPTFYYTVTSNDGTVNRVEETYSGTVTGNGTVDYVFTTPLDPKADDIMTLACGVDINGDSNPANNEVFLENLYVYAPFEFPYFTSFDDATENSFWQFIDNNRNGYCWEIGTMNEGGYVNNFLGFASSYGTYDDYAVSPAINVPTGKSRLSFYYAGIGGGAHLSVLMGDTPDIAKMEQVIFDRDVDGSGWKNGYALLDNETESIRYFAFHLTGSQDQVLIDNISVDAGDDLCIDGVTADIKSGYNLDKAAVTVTIANHGVNPQSNIRVRYGMNSLDEYVEETFEGTVNPGETVNYTFTEKADISVPEQPYRLYGNIATVVGDDTYNDSMQGDLIRHFANRTTPYLNDFAEDDIADRWTFSSESDNTGWFVTNSTDAYTPILGYDSEYVPTLAKVLKHRNKLSSTENSDNWAFSECLELEAGEHDLSFFFRTNRNWESDEYRQSIEVAFGAEPTADAMTIKAAELTDFIVPGVTYDKYNCHVTIPAAGRYYLGFHNVSATGSGETFIDRIRIDRRDNGKALPYKTDFAVNGNEWESYYPSAGFTQWIPDGTDMHLFRSDDSSQIGNLTHAEGILVSPKIALNGTKKVHVAFDYGFSTNDPATRLQLVAASVNHPDNFSVIAEYEASGVMIPVKCDFEPVAADGELWIGFRTNHFVREDDQFDGEGYDVRVANVLVADAETVGITDFSADGNFVKNGDILKSRDGATLVIYDMAGVRVAEGQEINVSGLKGMFILKTTSGDKNAHAKIML